MTKVTCLTCPYMQRDPANLSQGACRRYPPVPLLVPPGQITAFYPPVVPGETTCGEHPDFGKPVILPAQP